MAEYRALPWSEQAMLREGIHAEFGRQNWQPEAESPFEAPEPVYATDRVPEPTGGDITDNSLEALSHMGFTVRVVE